VESEKPQHYRLAQQQTLTAWTAGSPMTRMKRHTALYTRLHQLDNLTLRHRIQILKETTLTSRQLLLLNTALDLLNRHNLPLPE
jgi:hypothetical protein